MPHYFAAFTLLLLPGMVIIRVLLMRRQGLKAMQFGKIDKKDFLIPPFALFYFYLVFAAAFRLPSPGRQEFFHAAALNWAGVGLCFLGVALMLWSLISFGISSGLGRSR